jgi:hypothetical protein
VNRKLLREEKSTALLRAVHLSKPVLSAMLLRSEREKGLERSADDRCKIKGFAEASV